MKCPLLKGEMNLDDAGVSMEFIDCLKEECAWWSDEQKQCDPTGMLPFFIALGNTLGVIADRMPKDLAPRG